MLKSIATTTALAAATVLMPLAASARTTKPEASAEGAALIQTIESEAYNVRAKADVLASFNLADDVSWQTHAEQLSNIKVELNSMAANYSRLEAMRSELPAWQQKAIARIQPTLIEMANYTTSAIQFLNGHEKDLFSPKYTEQTAALDLKAGELTHVLRNYEDYAKAGTTEARMEQALGLRNGD